MTSANCFQPRQLDNEPHSPEESLGRNEIDNGRKQMIPIIGKSPGNNRIEVQKSVLVEVKNYQQTPRNMHPLFHLQRLSDIELHVS